MKISLQRLTMEQAISMGLQGYVLAPMSAGDVESIASLSCKELSAEIKANKQRTLTQNRAIHKYCSMLAKDLNDAGYDMKRVIKDEVDIPWSEGNAKEFLWRPVQKAMGLPESTADLATNEVSQVYEVLSRKLAQDYNITTPFPNRHGE